MENDLRWAEQVVKRLAKDTSPSSIGEIKL